MSDPQNFDEFYNGNRAFIIGGQTFHWRPLHWREWGELIDRRVADEQREEEEREKKIAALMKKKGNEEMSRLEASIVVDEEDEATVVETFEKLVDRAITYLVPNETESFKATMNDKDSGVSYAMLNSLMTWLQEVQAPDRPTEALSSSSSGPGTVGATSPAV